MGIIYQAAESIVNQVVHESLDEAIPDVEMGTQIQVNQGQTKQKNRKKKLHYTLFHLSYPTLTTNILNG